MSNEEEVKRFVVGFHTPVYFAIAQFDTKEQAMGFPESDFFKKSGYSLGYVYDRKTNKHFAGDNKFEEMDDQFALKISVAVSDK